MVLRVGAEALDEGGASASGASGANCRRGGARRRRAEERRRSERSRAARGATLVQEKEERRALEEERRALEEKERALEEKERGLERRSKGINKAELVCKEAFHSINEQRRRYNEHRNAACEDLEVGAVDGVARDLPPPAGDQVLVRVRDARPRRGSRLPICAEKASELLGVVGDNKQAAKLCKDLIKQGTYIHQTAENLDERGQHFTRLARERDAGVRVSPRRDPGLEVGHPGREARPREGAARPSRRPRLLVGDGQDLRRHRRPVAPLRGRRRPTGLGSSVCARSTWGSSV